MSGHREDREHVTTGDGARGAVFFEVSARLAWLCYDGARTTGVSEDGASMQVLDRWLVTSHL